MSKIHEILNSIKVKTENIGMWTSNMISKADVQFKKIQSILAIVVIPLNLVWLLYIILDSIITKPTRSTTLWVLFDQVVLYVFVALMLLSFIAGTYRIVLHIITHLFTGALSLFGGALGIACFQFVSGTILLIKGVIDCFIYMVLAMIVLCLPSGVVWYYILTESKNNNSIIRKSEYCVD